MDHKPRKLVESTELYEKAQTLMPGGVSSPVRAFKAVGGVPPFIKEADGAVLTDEDGNSYIDYVASYGPLIAGHANERVVAALSKAIGRGTSFGAPTEAEIQLASVITGALPGMEMIRFVNSGTEATMSAIRLARAATGRDLIAKCIGGYHGHADQLLAQAGSGVLTFAEKSAKQKLADSGGSPEPHTEALAAPADPSTPGVPRATVASTLLVQYNDLDATRAVFEVHGSRIAAFLVEPVPGNMGVIVPKEGYLAGLKEICNRHGTLLIFDEVMSGFRVAWGGAQVRYGVQPDLTCLGKVIGGGLPVGAYAGSKRLMEMISPVGPVYQAGTLSGNPLAMAAGISTLEILNEGDCYNVLERKSARLEDGLRAAAQDAGVAITINRVGAMLTAFFTASAGAPVTNYVEATACDTGKFKVFFHEMLNRGIYLPPSQFEAFFPGLAHTDEQIEETIAAAREAFAVVAKA
ncbi:MAG TPA: glutamate-1-semialdehyde 2,1-aminomutase [Tepidisphaeraceae bacterium]|jgi:glutamate-1-semialdehyde 2,1-aminomutase